VPVQFNERLVVYQCPVYVGNLDVYWDPELGKDELPKSIVLEHDAYTLDGASRKTIELLLEWNEVSGCPTHTTPN
jgi:RNAse (barnase) inhibitor barstar